MKIVQSFFSANRKIICGKFGWYNSKFHLQSWALSSQLLCRHYKNVQLYTDKQGYEILIDKLQLPYTAVHVELDGLVVYPKELWSLAKLKTYSLQTTPFLHVDADVYAWKAFNQQLFKGSLIAQNAEKQTKFYRQMIGEIIPALSYIPRVIKRQFEDDRPISCNAGILGGSDLNFFRQYTSKAFAMLERNQLNGLPYYILTNMNLFIEQILFFQLAKQQQVPVSYLIDAIYDDYGYRASEFANFLDPPRLHKYMHLIGGHKRTRSTCFQMANALRLNFPSSYKKVEKLFH